MRFGQLRHRKKNVQAIPTASLPDIIFILLFFFMATTALRKHETLVQQELPQSVMADNKPTLTDPVYLFLSAGSPPLVQLNNEAIVWDELEGHLIPLGDSLSQLGQTSVYFKADSTTGYQYISQAKQMLRKAGFTEILLATQANTPTAP